MKSSNFVFALLLLLLNLTGISVCADMDIYVRIMSGRKVAVVANEVAIIRDLKDQLPMGPLMVLTFAGDKLLDDDKLLSDLGIGAESELEVEWSKELAIKYLQKKNVIGLGWGEHDGDNGHSFISLESLMHFLDTTDFDEFRENVHAMYIADLDLHSLPLEISDSDLDSGSDFVNASLLLAAFGVQSLNVEFVHFLVQDYELDVNAYYMLNNQTLYSLMMCAQHLNGYEIAEFLIAKGADVNAKVQNGSNAEYGSILEFIQIFISEIEAGHANKEDEDSLQIAKKVERLFKSHGAKV